MNDIFKVLEVSASGMYAQRIRISVASSNIANYESYKVSGEPFRKLMPVFEAAEDQKNINHFTIPVKVVAIRESGEPFKLVYDPTNPRADAQGYVRLPNVELVKEMADMITASRSYEANLNAFNTTVDITRRTLELWR